MNPRIASWQGKRVWVIGASTGIGAETARKLLQAGARVMLSARNREGMEAIAKGHAQALVTTLDITDHATLVHARDAMLAQWQGIDLVLVVAGSHNEMRADDFDLAKARQLVDLNVGGVLNCLDIVLPELIRQGSGGLGIVASVAGYSGLPKALIYGATKAALINLTESLYLDLHARGIGVYLINPGFVDTPLTAKNDFPMPGLMSAPAAAAALVNGIARGDFHIHFPAGFTNSLRLARLLPYRLYFWLVRKTTGL